MNNIWKKEVHPGNPFSLILPPSANQDDRMSLLVTHGIGMLVSCDIWVIPHNPAAVCNNPCISLLESSATFRLSFVTCVCSFNKLLSGIAVPTKLLLTYANVVNRLASNLSTRHIVVFLQMVNHPKFVSIFVFLLLLTLAYELTLFVPWSPHTDSILSFLSIYL
jgi:hypothetical protein